LAFSAAGVWDPLSPHSPKEGRASSRSAPRTQRTASFSSSPARRSPRRRIPALLVVNDRPDIAKIVGADGVHLGQDDLPPAAARSLLGPNVIVGVSTHNVEQLEAAALAPVDYVAVGPIYQTPTKARPDPVVGLDLVRQARSSPTCSASTTCGKRRAASSARSTAREAGWCKIRRHGACVMSATLLDGVATARAIKDELRVRIGDLAARGVRPGLGALLVGDDPASAVYVRSKTKSCDELGMHHETVRLPATATTAEVVAQVEDFNRRSEIHGILVQLPLPPQVDADTVLKLVDPAKDVDGFHPCNIGLLVQKRPRFVACTPAGIMELLARNGIAVAGRRAVVLGRSDIVGKPMALLLLHADATVTVCHSKTRDLPAVTREADILVAAIGRAGLVRAEHVKPGAVVVDVGMNRVQDPSQARDLLEESRWADFEKRGSALVGDVHFPAVKQVASAITPVPGGVGPLTIALLMKNTVQAAQRASD
jgi:methylenetetrahydrofolate dehydrogenase (NADP+)/methenyltetrahydrofolate cyclohydrolase